jgi:hypothetical protein
LNTLADEGGFAHCTSTGGENGGEHPHRPAVDATCTPDRDRVQAVAAAAAKHKQQKSQKVAMVNGGWARVMDLTVSLHGQWFATCGKSGDGKGHTTGHLAVWDAGTGRHVQASRATLRGCSHWHGAQMGACWPQGRGIKLPCCGMWPQALLCKC